jgi:hypothetical protein
VFPGGADADEIDSDLELALHELNISSCRPRKIGQ